MMPFISSDHVLAAELALAGRLVRLELPLNRFRLGGGTTSNFRLWNPAAIQRMLVPAKSGALQVRLSTRRRHFEHVRAVTRSELPPAQKLVALEAATRPARRRLRARIEGSLDAGSDYAHRATLRSLGG